jgi:capsular polysaccharide biosynthesis protein
METLAEFGIRPEQIIRTDDRCHFEIERMVVASLKPSHLHVAKWVCDFLRGLVPGREPDAPCNRRLYISRASASFRRLLNEEEVFALLDEHGFEMVHCEALTVRQQRQLFSEAEMVVAPHGAALGNLVYCGACASVLELFSPNYVDVGMWPLTTHSRLVHTYALTQTAREKGGPRIEDMIFDVARLRRFLNSAFPRNSAGYLMANSNL